ncbi:hypothetical protein [Variovorax sp. KBW07]|nr:hypothetical protein [Variovorax sp. KBW07]
MKKIWFALLFLAGGIAHEVRNPVSCHSISTRQSDDLRKRTRKPQ